MSGICICIDYRITIINYYYYYYKCHGLQCCHHTVAGALYKI